MVKTLFLFATAILMGLCTSCLKSTRRNEVVKETYIHKYGVPIPKEDWSRNGKDGQVAQVLNDGTTVTRTFEKGVLNGLVTVSFPNSSTIHLVEVYDHGKLVSKTENYASGAPLEQTVYENDLISQITHWYEDGTPSALEFYENNRLLTGEYRTPLNMIDSKVIEGVGTRLLRGNDGEIAFKDVITNGQMTERVHYFPNHDPASITPYEDGKIHGTRLTFLAGGLPNTVEQWIHGIQEGITLVYLNGEKISEIPYTRGQKHGVEVRYRDGKTIVEEVTWENGVQHGPRNILLDETPQTEWYHQGELVSRTTFERLNPR